MTTCPKCGFEETAGFICRQCGTLLDVPDIDEFLSGIGRGAAEAELTPIVLFTQHFRIEGFFWMGGKKGYRSRVSDLLNQTDLQFLPVLQATLKRLGSDAKPQAVNVVMVNKSHVHLVLPRA